MPERTSSEQREGLNHTQKLARAPISEMTEGSWRGRANAAFSTACAADINLHRPQASVNHLHSYLKVPTRSNPATAEVQSQRQREVPAPWEALGVLGRTTGSRTPRARQSDRTGPLSKHSLLCPAAPSGRRPEAPDKIKLLLEPEKECSPKKGSCEVVRSPHAG